MTHRELVAEALRALAVDTLHSYAWVGQRFVLPPVDGPADEALVRELRERLYDDFYRTGGVVPVGTPPEPVIGPWPSETVAELSAANAGTGSRQAGWTIRSVDGHSVVVERAGLQVQATRAEVIAENGLRPGASVVVVVPKESFGLLGGFYAAFGDAGSGVAGDEGGGIDRFYWNVRPAGRVHLMRLLTSSLNRSRMPFRFKVLSDPRAYRCDAGVLYTPAELRSSVAESLNALLPDVMSHVRAATPAFTKRLAPGLAFAEDPPGGESFGERRCALLAQALVDAHIAGAVALEDRLAAVEARFAREGISLDAPHRNPGSVRDDPRGPAA